MESLHKCRSLEETCQKLDGKKKESERELHALKLECEELKKTTETAKTMVLANNDLTSNAENFSKSEIGFFLTSRRFGGTDTKDSAAGGSSFEC